MNFSKLISSFFIILVAIFFILLGIIFIMVPWLPAIRSHIISLLINNSVALSLFGIVSFTIGSAIAMNVILSARHRYYRIRSGANAVAVDETLIQQYLDSYWAKLFPNYDVPSRLILKNNRIHMVVNLPYLPLSEQKPLLERVESDLSEGFANVLGYNKEFYLTASFREQELSSTK
ncbi:MAG: hypothetical protein ACE5GN_07295 [Waddliaceae bacterium]